MKPPATAPTAPELACVVMSYQNQPGVLAAVRSLLAQSAPSEVLVVNSGGGDPAAALHAEGLDVPVLNIPERLYPGAVCNAGLRATRAPFVAFLPGDCVAESGWTASRLQLHLSGQRMVSCPVTNATPHNILSWASYILLFAYRMPGTPPRLAQHYGVSYDRRLFDEFGPFREDLRAGEDTEFNQRAASAGPILWAPEIRYAHRHPTTFSALLRDQYRRGARMTRSQSQIAGRSRRWDVAVNAAKRWPACLRHAWRAAGADDRRRIARAAPFTLPATLAYSFGALLARGPTP